jgi:hypothetical protein
MRPIVSLTPMLAIACTLAGCHDSTAPRDPVPPRDQVAPAAPRDFYSVTGDHRVFLHWLPNTESDVAGYRVYMSPCSSGPDCPYDPVGATTGTEFTVTGLVNGQTRYFAVTAFDAAGNESPLTREDVFDTPRPEGFDQVLTDASVAPATSGWDFSRYAVRAYDDSTVDIYYVRVVSTAKPAGVDRMIAPFTDTEIQDAGYASTLDAIDFAPPGGWAPSGTVELITGHCYVVKTNGDHYAKFRVTGLGASGMVMDWAYQVDPGNRELHAHPAARDTGRVRRAVALAVAR